VGDDAFIIRAEVTSPSLFMPLGPVGLSKVFPGECLDG
jgi:hypothetical protein